MTSANRTRVTVVRETTPGTTPGSPRMRTARMTGESLAFQPNFVDSDEIRADRMTSDPILVMKESGGGVNVEMSYPEDSSPLSEFLRSVFMAAWTNTPTFFNDGTADSVVTDAGTVANTYAVTAGGAAVVAGHLVQASGFTNPANNQVFKAAAGSGTTIVGTALGLTAEAAPPATAKLKVVGFQGAAGDVTAAANGLASTALDFTTLGLQVGQWLKVGGTIAGSKFATAACNDWIRITAIAAHALTCDNLPAGWAIDAGAGKTISVWFGDTIKNGVLQSTMTIERGFMGQAVPTYIVNTGMQIDTFQFNLTSRDKIKGVVTFKGLGGTQGTVTLSGSPDAATTNAVMAANANVGRLAENGATLSSPNWARSLEFTINNNLRAVESVDQQSPVAQREGECTVTGKIDTYFGDNTLLTKFYNNTPTSISSRIAKNGQAMIFQIPRATYNSDGNPSASQKNTDVMSPFGWKASYDPLTAAHVLMDRIPYFEV